MKKTIISMMTIMLVFILSASTQSCSNYESPLTGQKVSDIVMEETEGFYDVTFGNADLSNIKTQSSETWCIPSVNGKSIRVNVQANDSYGERKAMVVLIDSKNGTSLSFYVIQKQNNAIIPSSPGFAIGADGGTFTLGIQTNVDFKVEIPADCDWLKEGFAKFQTRGLQIAELILTASQNTGKEYREVTIHLVNHELGLSVPIKITQLTQPPI